MAHTDFDADLRVADGHPVVAITEIIDEEQHDVGALGAYGGTKEHQ